MPQSTLTLLLCSPNLPSASIPQYTHSEHEPIPMCNIAYHRIIPDHNTKIIDSVFGWGDKQLYKPLTV